MFKVFLVEDEIVVRESIRDNVDWESAGFTFSGEASDGEMALPMLEEIRPDVLITDIKMPFIDGLELARIAKKNMPRIRIVILSGYEEFTFAQQAIGFKASEYLLKPIGSEDLVKVLKKLADELEEETRERQQYTDLNRHLNDSIQLMRERFLNDLATGVVPSSDAVNRASGLGLSIIAHYYNVALVRTVDEREVDPHRLYSECLRAEELMGEILADNPDVLRFPRSLKEQILIFKGDDKAELESRCHQMCRTIKYEVENNTSIGITISVGSAWERVQGISQSLAEAEAAAKFRFIFGDTSIIDIKDAERANFRSAHKLQVDHEPILSCLRIGERDRLPELVSDFVDKVNSGALSSFLIGYAVVDLVFAVAKFVEELGGTAEQTLRGLDEIEQRIVTNENRDTLKEYLEDILSSAFEFRENRKQDKYGDIISSAKEYIRVAFSEPDVSLGTVSGHVSVSPSHFSTIFSQATGETFIEYLTRTRMAAAMELLKSTNLRSSEIAYKVGYNDPHYFSFIFKKRTGTTPSDFRRGGTATDQVKRQSVDVV